MELVEIARRLRNDVKRLRFAKPVAYVYSPLDYAWKPHRAYLERYGSSWKARHGSVIQALERGQFRGLAGLAGFLAGL